MIQLVEFGRDLMSKHYLEAHIGGPIKDFGYRIICVEPETCQQEQRHRKGCIFKQLFNKMGMSMMNWPMGDIIIGRIEVLGDVKPRDFPVQEPEEAWFTPKEDQNG
jgi:hypothetical protein